MCSLVFACLCYSLLIGAALSILIGSISPLMVGFAAMGAYSTVVEAVYVWSALSVFLHGKSA
jgi:hypothetical protein